MNTKKYSHGFTLIELLVVIAIIGILASVVLASLSDARKRAQDSANKSNLVSLRTEAELYYQQHGNYTASGSFPPGSAPCTYEVFLGPRSLVYREAIQKNLSSGSMICTVGLGRQTWAVAVPMQSKPPHENWYMCVDTTGIIRERSYPGGTGIHNSLGGGTFAPAACAID